MPPNSSAKWSVVLIECAMASGANIAQHIINKAFIVLTLLFIAKESTTLQLQVCVLPYYNTPVEIGLGLNNGRSKSSLMNHADGRFAETLLRGFLVEVG